MSKAHTRVTLVGQGRNVELVLPTDASIGTLLPEVLARFEPTSAANPTIKTLTVDGIGSLEWHRSLADHGVPDGAVVRVTDRVDAVPSPVVYDVVDETAVTRPGSLDWPHGRARTIGTTVVSAALVALAAHTVDSALSDRAALWTITAACSVVLALLAVLDARRAGVAIPLAAVALALGTQSGLPVVGLMAMASAGVLAWFCGHRRWRHLSLGAGALALLAALWLVCWWWWWTSPRAGAVAGAGTMLLLGLLPRLAIMLTGLASLDDRTLRGEPLQRTLAVEAIEAAHEGLAVAVAGCAVSGYAAVRLLSGGMHHDRWMVALSLLLLALMALRSRVFPLVTQRVALLLASGAGLLAVGSRLIADGTIPWHLLVLALAGLAIAAIASLVAHPSDHAAARVRLLAGRVESLLTLALVPVVVGLFGVYGDLATVFQR